MAREAMVARSGSTVVCKRTHDTASRHGLTRRWALFKRLGRARLVDDEPGKHNGDLSDKYASITWMDALFKEYLTERWLGKGLGSQADRCHSHWVGLKERWHCREQEAERIEFMPGCLCKASFLRGICFFL